MAIDIDFDWNDILARGGPTINEVVAEAAKEPCPRTMQIVKGDFVLECGVRKATETECELDWLRFTCPEA